MSNSGYFTSKNFSSEKFTFIIKEGKFSEEGQVFFLIPTDLFLKG